MRDDGRDLAWKEEENPGETVLPLEWRPGQHGEGWTLGILCIAVGYKDVLKGLGRTDPIV